MRQAILILVSGALALSGCSGDVKAPKPSSVSELKASTLASIDNLQKAIDENHVHPSDMQGLGSSLLWLRGHMESTKVGTEEQLRALQEALNALAELGGARMKPPEDWRPSDGPPPPPVIQPGPLKDLLPQIRKIVTEVPDSNARPDRSGS